MSNLAGSNSQPGGNNSAKSTGLPCSGSESRRGFLRESSILIAGAMPGRLPASGSPPIGDSERVGILGCGRRGIQLAARLLEENPAARLIAVGDVLPDAVQRCVRTLSSKYRDQIDLALRDRLIGFDAESTILEKEVDTLIIAGCPADRPRQIESAIARKIGVVSARPIAIDAKGLAQFEAACVKAADSGLKLDIPNDLSNNLQVQQSIQFVRSGGVGRVLSLRALSTARPLPKWESRKRESPEANRIRNWQHFAVLSGGGPLEELADRLDVCNQVAGCQPKTAQGIGSFNPEAADTLNRLAVEMDYGQVRLQAFWRRSSIDFSGCTLSAHGTDGWCDLLAGKGMDHDNRIVWSAASSAPIACRASDRPLLDAGRALQASTAAILARDAAVSGRCVSANSLA